MKKRLVVLISLFSISAMADCPVGTTAPSLDGKETCELAGGQYSDLVLDSSRVWVLGGQVAIGGDNTASATLTIEPGTKIVGRTESYLLIRRGSKIMARGTASAPIVFTSPKADPRRGDWGGVVINGNAPVNGCSAALCELNGEGDSGLYGGTNAADNSGVLEYVRIEYAGHLYNDEDELNGLALQGVGSGTKIENIQVHMANDDGIEMFGGTVNMKRVLVTGTKDDAFDWTYGWKGKAQFVVLQQYADEGNRGIEADNNKKIKNANPRSNPTLSNFTIVGNLSARKGSHGILLRHGTAAQIFNTVVTTAKKACIDIDHSATFAHAIVEGPRKRYNLKMENSIVDCGTPFKDDEVEKDENGNVIFADTFKVSDWFKSQRGNMIVDPALSRVSSAAPEQNDWVPTAGSPALGNGKRVPGAFFEPVDFIGAMKDRGSDWTAGWTVR